MQKHCNARWMRILRHAFALSSLLLPLGASTGIAATKPEITWQPYACPPDAVVQFVSFQGVSLSVQEHGLNYGTDSGGGLVTITPGTKVNSMSFAVRGYTDLNITLTGNKGTAKATVNNASIHKFVSWTLTSKDFKGNAGNVSSIKISVNNNSNFGFAPTYVQSLQINGKPADVILKSAGCIE